MSSLFERLARHVAVAAVISSPALAQPSPAQSPTTWPAFTQQFRDYVAADGIVGASALIMRKGLVISRVDLGQQDRAASAPVTDRTIYHWGSITKSLTAIAILQLRDRGRLSLDDKVTRYLPELRRVHDPYGRIDSITIRMLLAHTAGFRNGTWPYGDGSPWQPFEPTTWEQLVAMMPYQSLLFPPGARYGYSNPGYIYLGRIVEQLTGDPWDAYVQKNVFAPLGMTRSSFRSTPFWLAADRSHNYEIVKDSSSGAARLVDNGADFDPGITTPNGGWNAPLADLVTYVSFLTGVVPAGGSQARHDVVLSRASLREMWTAVAPMSAGYEASAGQSIGLGFFLQGDGDRRVIGHTGSQAGFRAFYYFNPATTTAVIAAFNTTNYAAPARETYNRMHEAAKAMVRESGR